MSSETVTPEARLRSALAALELAWIRQRRAVREALRIGEEELSALLYLGHHGGVTQRRLGIATALSRSGAGAMVQRLEDRGYVVRSTDPTDRRLRLVELSPSARERLDHAYAGIAAAVGAVVGERTEAEVEALAVMMDGIAQGAGEVEVLDEPATAPLSDAGDPIWRRWA